MKKLLTTALATMVAVYGYSQTYLPVTGGNLSGQIRVDLPSTGNSFVGTGGNSNIHINHDASSTVNFINSAGGGFSFNGALSGTSAIFRGNIVSDGANNGNISNLNFTRTDASYRVSNETNFRIYGQYANTLTPSALLFDLNPLGAATLYGSLTGTSATFSSDVSARNVSMQDGYGLNAGNFQVGAISANRFYIYNNTLGLDNISIAPSTGMTTFARGITGTSATFSNDLIARQVTISDGYGLNAGNFQMGAISANRFYIYNTTLGLDNISIAPSTGITTFARSIVGTSATFSDNINIGTTQTNANLYVHGTIKSKEVKVEATVSVPDYVFEKSYDLKSLVEVEQYITQNKHLPEIPSAKEIGKDGINVGEMQMKLLQKIEELTLHLIDLNKQVDTNKRETELLKKKNQDLENEVVQLKVNK